MPGNDARLLQDLPTPPAQVAGRWTVRNRWPAIALLVAAFILACASISTIDDPPSEGFGSIATSGDSSHILWVMPGGYAAEAGLRAGDSVKRAALPEGSSGWEALLVVKGIRVGQTVVLSRRWPSEADLVLFVLGLEFLAAGLLVFHAASDRDGARRFLFLAIAAGATMVAFPAIGNGHPWALCLEWIGSKLGMAAFVSFFLTIPVPRWPRLRRVLLWAPVPILLLYGYTIAGTPDLYGVVKLLGYSYMAIGGATSLTAMALPFIMRAPREQKRLWPIAVCSGLAIGIYLTTSLLPFLLLRHYLIPAELSILSLGFLPLGFMWAMSRYPVMGIAIGNSAILKPVFETISDPIFVVDRNGILVDCSRSGLELLGISSVRQLKTPLADTIYHLEIAQDECPTLGNTIRMVLDGKAVGEREHRITTHGGPIWLGVASTRVYDERGNVQMGVFVCRDITERKHREELQKDLDRQKDEFIAGISHDLRTPLTTIKYSTEVVLANEPPGISEPLHRMLVNVDLAADRMSAMIEDLLELGRLRAGRAQLRLGSCDLRDIAQRSAATIEALAASRRQQLILELPAMPIIVTADSCKLERAVTNLVSNAHKYGNEGTVIKLSVERRNGDALIAVADDGPGIPREEQGRVFERFYRIGSEIGQPRGGIGLGLPISRATVEMHGGRLWVESAPGAGATFWISLPAPQPVLGGSEDGDVEDTDS